MLVEVTNLGYHNVPGKFEMTVQLTRVLFPFILFVSLAAAVMGMLNARFVFGVPASASTVFNIVSIFAGVGLAYAFDPSARSDWTHPLFDERALFGVGLGVLLGGLAQLAMQLPSLYGWASASAGGSSSATLALSRLWSLMWPSVVAGAAVQVNVLVNGNFASEINGGRSWLACAFRLMQFPIGIFGVSLATATLPAVARAFSRGDMAAFRAHGAGFAAAGLVPGLAGLGGPGGAGRSDHRPDLPARPLQRARHRPDRPGPAGLFRGLAGYAAIKVLTPCFYALGLPRVADADQLHRHRRKPDAQPAERQGFRPGSRRPRADHLMRRPDQLPSVDGGAEPAGRPGRLGAVGRVPRALRRRGGVVRRRGLGRRPSGRVGHATAARCAPRGWAIAIGASVLVYFGAARLLRLEESAQAWRMIRRRLPGG